MSVVFISHSSKDDSYADALEVWLKANGVTSVFIDHSCIAAGDKWRDALRAFAKTCRAVICLVTPNWLASDECFGEFTAALYMSKHIIPLILLPSSAALDPDAKDRLNKVSSEYQGVDILPCLNSIGALDIDAVPSASDRVKAGLRRLGEDRDWMGIPVRKWRGAPGALLRADHAVVPFHGREAELAELRDWVLDERGSLVQLLTGSGGMGKSRLARELRLQLREEGIEAGFLELAECGQCLSYLKDCQDEPTLLVVDYAETAGEKVADMLHIAARREFAQFRLLLLARGGSWWTKLKRMGDGVGDCLRNEPKMLRPLALDIEARHISYRLACRAFAEKLGQPEPASEPSDLDAQYYQRTSSSTWQPCLPFKTSMFKEWNQFLKQF